VYLTRSLAEGKKGKAKRQKGKKAKRQKGKKGKREKMLQFSPEAS